MEKKSADFYNKKVPKEDSEYNCWSVILLDWVYEKDKKSGLKNIGFCFQKHKKVPSFPLKIYKNFF